METAATIVAPEGIYSLTEELKPLQAVSLIASTPILFPTRVSTVTIKYPSKTTAQGLSGLLSGSRNPQPQPAAAPAAPAAKETDSAGSSDNINQDDAAGSNGSSGAVNASSTNNNNNNLHQHSLFAQPTQNGKRKAQSRPKHNMKTTSSAFVTRHQSTEGLNRILQAKQGDVTFTIYNSAKSLFWSEVGARAKASPADSEPLIVCMDSLNCAGASTSCHILGCPYVSRHQPRNCGP